jgi:Ca2+-binding RTX toxin-like protein
VKATDTGNRPGRWLAVALLVIPFIAGADLAARADRTTVEDADDSGSAIDVARVKQGHYAGYVVYRVFAYEQWDHAALKDGRIVFSFNTDDDSGIERRGIVEYDGGAGPQLRMKIVNGRGRRLGRGVVGRPGRLSVWVWIARWQLERVRRYEMSVTVSTKASEECAHGCRDRVPETGSVSHRLHRLCSGEEPRLVGTRGPDLLRGTKRRDIIAAGGGDDRIKDVRKNDTVCGGWGDDVIRAGRGYLSLFGGPGSDRFTATGPRPSPCDDVNVGRDARAQLRSCIFPEAFVSGGSGRDVLIGGRYHEHLRGGRGADVVRGSKWSDRLNGGRGHDLLRGGAGADGCFRGEELHSCSKR